MNEKLYQAEYTPQAFSDIKKLDKQNQKRVIRTVRLFEELGQDGVNSRPLDNDGLFEMKCDKIRIYFMYEAERIIIIGLVALKKTQKAPVRYKIQAKNNIRNYLKLIDKE